MKGVKFELFGSKKCQLATVSDTAADAVVWRNTACRYVNSKSDV